jgi:hypothetical protein
MLFQTFSSILICFVRLCFWHVLMTAYYGIDNGQMRSKHCLPFLSFLYSSVAIRNRAALSKLLTGFNYGV